jgi:hypothetical protein
VRLLVLDAADVRSILLHHPGLAARVAHARPRRATRAVPQAGVDLARSELQHQATGGSGEAPPRRAGRRVRRGSRGDSTG